MTLAFVGGGNMARALIGGLLQRGVASARIRVSEPQQAARAALAADFGVMVTADNEAALRGADCLILAVKPQVMRGVCEGLRAALPSHTIVVSIAAGIRVDQLSAWLGGHDRIVRCMPNTPALLRAGATGLFASGGCSETDRTRADTLLSAVGTTAWIADEALMDAVTALSGSGPAYVFLLAEAMTEFGWTASRLRKRVIRLPNLPGQAWNCLYLGEARRDGEGDAARRELERLFEFRHRVTREACEGS